MLPYWGKQIKDLVMKDYSGFWGRILIISTGVLVRWAWGSEGRTGEDKGTAGWRLERSRCKPRNAAAPEAGRGGGGILSWSTWRDAVLPTP